MAVSTFMLITALIIVAILAFRVFTGAAKQIISIGLLCLAGLILIFYLTGFDPAGIGPTANVVAETGEKVLNVSTETADMLITVDSFSSSSTAEE